MHNALNNVEICSWYKLKFMSVLDLEGNVGLPMDIISATKSGLSGFLQFMLERLNCKYVMAVVVTTAACLLWLPSSVKYQQQCLLLTKSTSTEPQKFILSTLILMCVRCVWNFYFCINFSLLCRAVIPTIQLK